MSTFFSDLSAAVKDGVKEFSQNALTETVAITGETVKDVKKSVKEGTQTVVGIGSGTKEDTSAEPTNILKRKARPGKPFRPVVAGTIQQEEKNASADGKGGSYEASGRTGESEEEVPSTTTTSAVRSGSSLEKLKRSMDLLLGFVAGLKSYNEPETKELERIKGECHNLLERCQKESRKSQMEYGSLQRRLRKEMSDSQALEENVNQITEELGSKLQRFKEEAREKVQEAQNMRAAKEQLEKGIEELKLVLQDTVQERKELVQRVSELETSNRKLKSEAKKAKQLSKKVQSLQEEKDEKSEEAAKSKAMGIAESEMLQGRILAAERIAADAEKRCKEAEQRAQAANDARETAENACRVAEESALLSAQRAEASTSQLEIERGSREQAEDVKDKLHQESERRRVAFNHAVQASVGKIERELKSESERLMQELGVLRENLMEAEDKASEAVRELNLARKECESTKRDAIIAGKRAEAAEAAAAEAIYAKQASDEKASEIESERANLEMNYQASLEAKEKEAEGQLNEAKSQLSVFRERAVSQVTDMQTEISNLKKELSQAQDKALLSEQRALKEVESMRASNENKEALALSQSRIKELEARLADAETKISQKKKTSSNFASAKSFSLDNIGLGNFRKTQDAPLPLSSKRSQINSQRGQVSLRTWLIAAYLIVLHLMVMSTFTKHQELHELHNECKRQLPGYGIE